VINEARVMDGEGGYNAVNYEKIDNNK